MRETNQISANGRLTGAHCSAGHGLNMVMCAACLCTKQDGLLTTCKKSLHMLAIDVDWDAARPIHSTSGSFPDHPVVLAINNPAHPHSLHTEPEFVNMQACSQCVTPASVTQQLWAQEDRRLGSRAQDHQALRQDEFRHLCAAALLVPRGAVPLPPQLLLRGAPAWRPARSAYQCASVLPCKWHQDAQQ